MKNRVVGLFAAGLVMASLVAQADDPKQASEAKGQAAVVASTIDFCGVLGLDFASLRGLGGRIDQARSCDPVGLALAARELEIAEKVSGKTASITSEQLRKEAVDVARHRGVVEELNAVAMMSDEATAKELRDNAAKMEKARADQKKAKESGERTKGITGRLHVDNRTYHAIQVYVNGYYVGTVGPMGDGYMNVGDSPWNTTSLFARSVAATWGTMYVNGAISDYTWLLTN